MIPYTKFKTAKPMYKVLYLKVSLIFLILNSCITQSSEAQKSYQDFDLEMALTESGYIKLPLQKMRSGHLHLYGELNGVKGNFILDTGAGFTVIEEKNKVKFHMQTKATDQRATGAGGTGMRVQVSESNTFKLKGLRLSGIDLRLMNLDHVNNAFESLGLAKADGVIGADILTGSKAVIDYAKLVLYLKN